MRGGGNVSYKKTENTLQIVMLSLVKTQSVNLKKFY